MCGYVFLFNDQGGRPVDIQDLVRVTDLIHHRGPDDQGTYTDDHVYMGFQRLSIIDLEHGHQPFAYGADRYQIVFNGEIYNYIELSALLRKEGAELNTKSDTEVLIALYSIFKDKMLEYLRGMFSFVIWDKQERRMFGARDHFGMKPFYYHQDGDNLYCASEKKSLMALKDRWTVNIQAYHHYLSFQYAPEPETMIREIQLLRPGHYIRKELNGPLQIGQYWESMYVPTQGSYHGKLKAIREVLTDSVKVHLRSDVPVGVFLSGGVDSTIIASIAGRMNPNIQTFTVGFEREGYSEIDVAKASAERLKLDNISTVITAEAFAGEIPRIVWHMDSPMADPSSIPLYFLAKEAGRHVKTVLSGEGSDELFGGYNIYREPDSLRLFSYLPPYLKRLLRQFSDLLPTGMKGKSFIDRGCIPMEERYIGNANIIKQHEKGRFIPDFDVTIVPQMVTKPYYDAICALDPVSKMQYIDVHTWLPGDILVKADRMSMAHSLESRMPFLDKEVFKVASTLTKEEKVRGKATKVALREAFRDVVPEHVVDRKKLGFPVPIRHWLKDELYGWAQDTIRDSRVEDYVKKDAVLRLLEEHREGRGDYSRMLWVLLIFMVWHQIFFEKKYVFEKHEVCRPGA